MADSYIQGSFAFTCTHAEMALIEEAFQASFDLQDGHHASGPTEEFLLAFPPVAPDDPWSGFLAIFPDPDFPNLGVDFEGGNTLDQPDVSCAYFSGTTDFQPHALAALIRHCCQTTLHSAPVVFEWACSCARARIGEFGGGACVVFPDRIIFETTRGMIERALAPDNSLAPAAGEDQGWAEHPDHGVTDWQAEVAIDDTRLGYWAWVAARLS